MNRISNKLIDRRISKVSLAYFLSILVSICIQPPAKGTESTANAIIGNSVESDSLPLQSYRAGLLDNSDGTSSNGDQLNDIVTLTGMQISVPDFTPESQSQDVAVTIRLMFDDTVFVVGSPHLEFEVTDEESRLAQYLDGSGTKTLDFGYFVAAEETRSGKLYLNNPHFVFDRDEHIRDVNNRDVKVPHSRNSQNSSATRTFPESSPNPAAKTQDILQTKIREFISERVASSQIHEESLEILEPTVSPSFDSILVAWKPIRGAEGYSVQWRRNIEEFESGGSREHIVNSESTTQYTIPNLSSDSKYEVRVSPIDGSNNRVLGDEIQVSTTDMSSVRLVDLTLRDAKNNKTKLDPEFSPDILEYSASVSSGVRWVTPYPVMEDSSSFTEYFDHKGKRIQDSKSRTKGVQIALNRGTNAFILRVTSPDGTKSQEYALSIEREKAKLPRPDLLEMAAAVVAGAGAYAVRTDEDDDPIPKLRFDDIEVLESANAANITLSLDVSSNRDVQVQYSTTDDTASADSDYSATSGTVTIRSGQKSALLSVSVTQDETDEPDESFIFRIGSITPSGSVTLLNDSAKITIVDDEATPTLSIDDVNVLESDEVAIFTITMSGRSSRDVSVLYNISDDTALAGSDYSPTNDLATIPAGQIATTFTVPINQDLVDEPNESFNVSLSNIEPDGWATFARSAALATISDDDDTPKLTIADVTVAESGENANFSVTLSGHSSQEIEVAYATTAGTADADADYTATSGRISISPLTTNAEISIPILQDNIDELSESFMVSLRSVHPPRSSTIGKATAIGSITDDDERPTLSVQNVTVSETDSKATFVVRLSGLSSRNVSVQYSTKDVSATAGADYSDTVGSMTIEAGTTEATFDVPILQDKVSEPIEEFSVSLTDISPVDAVTASSVVANATIIDDDLIPVLTISNVTVTESDKTATLNLQLSGPSSQAISVSYATEDDTATAGADYVSTEGTAYLPAGQTKTSISVPLIQDEVEESRERFTVNISNPSPSSAVQIGKRSATVVIKDDDIVATELSIGSVTVLESAGSASFTVTLSRPVNDVVTFNYETSDGTATSGFDYTYSSGTALIASGFTYSTFAVPILQDQVIELRETFDVTLSNLASASNVVFLDHEVTATIMDDEPLPTLEMADVTVSESAATAKVTVTMSDVHSQNVSFNFSSSDGTAIAGKDYQSNEGTKTIKAGQTSASFSMSILQDKKQEPNEVFTVSITDISPSGFALISDGSSVVTIVDDDSELGRDDPGNTVRTIGIDDVRVDESDGVATFSVHMNQSTSQDVMLNYATADGTALALSDYTATSGSITIDTGQTTASVTVTILQDLLVEGDESFTLTLSNASPTDVAIISDDTAIGVITDDDAEDPVILPPTLSIADAIVAESVGNATFTVSMSKTASDAVTLNYETSNGSATAASDYTSTNGSVTINAGQTTATIMVPILQDSTIEENETFTVTISDVNPGGSATITDNTAIGTITDDDNEPTDAGVPSLSIADVTISESGGNATFSISLSESTNQQVTVDYATSDGSATAASDYTSTNTSATIDAGQISETFDVPILDDTNDEPNETFTVTLSNVNPAGAAEISDGTAIGTITDDDEPVVVVRNVKIEDVTVSESEETLIFTVSLDGPVDEEVNVDYETADGTSIADEDYTAMMGTTTINEGQTKSEIEVQILQDTEDETDEYFMIYLRTVRPGSKAIIERESARATILDDDEAQGICGRTPEVQDQILIRLYARYGDIDCSEVTDEMLPLVTGMQLIDMTYTGISRLKPGDFEGLINVKDLYINGQTLTTLFAGIFDGMPNLEEMWLFDNAISSISPGAFRDLPKLEFISLSNNDVSLISSGVLTELPELQMIILIDNELDDIPWDDIESLPKLIGLYLARNPGFDISGRVYIDRANISIAQGQSASYSVRFSSSPELSTPELDVFLDVSPSHAFVTATPARLTFQRENWFRLQEISVSVAQDAPLVPAVISHSTVPKQDYSYVEPMPKITVNVTPSLSNGISANSYLESVSIEQPQRDLGWLPGDVIALTFEFTSVVTVDEKASDLQIPVIVNGYPQRAVYETGNGTSRITFGYTVPQDSQVTRYVLIPNNSLNAIAGELKAASGSILLLKHQSVQSEYPSDAVSAPDTTPVLSISDGHSSEADDSTISFTLNLNRTSAEPVSVSFFTEDLTALAGEDYESKSGTHIFKPGETEAQVHVSVRLDSKVENDETFYLHLVDADGIVLQQQSAIGTIHDIAKDSIATMTSIGIALVDQILSVIDNQFGMKKESGFFIESPIMPASPTNFAGTTPDANGYLPTTAPDTISLNLGHVDNNGKKRQSYYRSSVRNLLANSDFSCSVQDDNENRLTLWAQTASSYYSDRFNEARSTGDVATATIGIDYSRSNWTSGLLFSLSDASGKSETSSQSSLDSNLTGVFPYARISLSDRLFVQTVVGYVRGDAEGTGTADIGSKSGVTMIMFAPSIEGSLGVTRLNHPWQTSIRSDALFVRINTTSARGTRYGESNLSRLRLGLKNEYRISLYDNIFVSPTIELAMRYDSGDFANGLGLDLVGGVKVTSSKLGLSASVKGRNLVLHESDTVQQFSYSGNFSWRPTRFRNVGPYVLLDQSIGRPAYGSSNQLLSSSNFNYPQSGVVDVSRHLRLTVGYATPLFEQSWVSTPELIYDSTRERHEYVLGWGLLHMRPHNLNIRVKAETGWQETLVHNSDGLVSKVGVVLQW